jgi:hypothetical protein
MDKRNPGLHQLLQDVYATTDDELFCDGAATLMVRAAARPLSDAEMQQQYPQLQHHFRFCPACAAEFDILRDLMQAMESGELKPPATIPPTPDADQPTLWQQTRDAIMAIFPSFQPALATQVRHGGDTLAFDPVEVPLGGGTVIFTFDVAVAEDEPTQRNLFCTITVTGERLVERLEGTPIWLQTGIDGPAIQEQTVNELGDVSFSYISPGQYALRMELMGQAYVITQINVP